MKKALALITLFLFATGLYAQKLEIDILDEEQDNMYYHVTFGEGQKKSGKKEGKWIVYRADIFTTSLRTSLPNNYHQFVEYATLQKKKEVIKSNAGIDKIKIAEGNYSKDEQTGEWKYFLPTFENPFEGELVEIRNYVNGVLHGEWKKFFHDQFKKLGQVETLGNYVNGALHGEYKWYHENGQLRAIGTMTHGEQMGEWKYYHEDGTLKETVNH